MEEALGDGKALDDGKAIKAHVFYDGIPPSKDDLKMIPYGQFRSYTRHTIMLLNIFLDQVGIYDANLLQIEQQIKEESQLLSMTYRY